MKLTLSPATALLCAALVSASLGCSLRRDQAEALVRVHANRDLVCPDREIDVRTLWGGRYRASGCGRTAIYESLCEGLQCTVGLEGEDSTGWRDRPAPGSIEERR